MLGKFIYHNPTKLYFGEDAIENMESEMNKYGNKIMLVYGGGSIKKNGLYQKIISLLRKCNKQVVEESGVMPNPTLAKFQEGLALARKENVDFILAVGGGSVIDYGKAIAISVNCTENPWERYFKRMEDVSCDVLPVGAVLTMAGTGSEMDGGMVITNPPYGERLLDVRQAQELYRALGQVFRPRRGWSLGVISPDPEFESLFGRKADKRRKLYNGMIQCQYYQYFRGSDKR